MKAIDIKDMKFGGVIARKRLPQYKNGATYWECECIYCKKLKAMPLTTIRRSPFSCGCVKEDMTGRWHGLVEVVGMLVNEKKVACICHKCGKQFTEDRYYVKKLTACPECSRGGSGEKISATLDKKGYRQNGTYTAAWGERKINKNNSSGHRGVSWYSSRSKWRTYIKFQGNNIELGRFDRKEDAISTRKAAEDFIKESLNSGGEISADLIRQNAGKSKKKVAAV